MKCKTKLFSILVILAVMLAYMPANLTGEVYAETKAGQWQESGSGTQYYAEFPSGYDTNSSLYGKYNNEMLSPYENADSKREVSTTRVSYIYWHWTFNNQPLPNDNYNVFINDHSGWSEGRNYQFFADFESSEDYSEYDPAGHHDKVPGLCYYHWRGNASDGSWWWFRIPIYMQTYTDYKFVSSDDGSDSKSNDSNIDNNNADANNNSTDTAAVFDPETSNTGSAKKYTPKTTDVYKCSPKKNSCSMKWKKCPGKCTGYQIRYCTNKQFKKCRTKRIKGRSNCSCTLKGLKAGKTYYCQIRCYRKVGKKTCFSGWTKCKSFKTKKAAKITGKKNEKKNKTHRTNRTKTMTVYSSCIKNGDIVYCNCKGGLFKVDIQTGIVTTLSTNNRLSRLSLKGAYLYGSFQTYGVGSYFFRINTNTGSYNSLEEDVQSYAIRGSKIYYSKKDWVKEKSYKKVMNLDGRSKRSTNIKTKNKYKTTNATGYYTWTDWDGDYNHPANYYLRTPSGDILLLHDDSHYDV